MRKDNYAYFPSTIGNPKDNGFNGLAKRNELQEFKHLVIGEAKAIKKCGLCHIALPI